MHCQDQSSPFGDLAHGLNYARGFITTTGEIKLSVTAGESIEIDQEITLDLSII